jgi:uncharacterized membrane protein
MPALQPILDLVMKLVPVLTPILDIVVELVTNVLEPLITEVLIPIMDFIAKIFNILKPYLPLLMTIAGAVLNVFIALNPILLLVTGILAMIHYLKQAFSDTSTAADGTTESTRELERTINDAVIAQEKLLQKINDGERLTDKEVEGQKLLLKHLEDRRKKNGQLNDEELKQRSQAQAIISKNNIAAISELTEQFEEGRNISKGLEEQEKRLNELNALKKNGRQLSTDEKREIKEINDLLEKQAEQKHNTEKIEKKYGQLSKERQAQAIKNVKTYEDRIILIVNGFDLVHRLETSYNYFINDLKTKESNTQNVFLRQLYHITEEKIGVI